MMRLNSATSAVTAASSTELKAPNTASGDTSLGRPSRATEARPRSSVAADGQMKNSARDRSTAAAAPSPDAPDGELANTAEEPSPKIEPEPAPTDLEGLY